MNPFSFLDGFKTYLAGAGLFGLALYQFSTGDYASAWQSMMAALAAVSIKHAVSRAVDTSVTDVPAVEPKK